MLPGKKKYMRGNLSPSINKEFSKGTTLHSKLRNKLMKERTEESRHR